MTPIFTAEQIEFERAVGELLAEAWADDVRERVASGVPSGEIDMGPVHRRLGKHRWLAASWPPEYGGLGKTAVEAAILHRELVRNGFPDLVYVVSICYVGNFLLLAGNERLKQTYLPRLASGEISACTLYSEPGAGSDLGSLTSTAEPADGSFRLHGTKIYSQGTQFADYGLVAARVPGAGQSKYDGITLFWVPLRSAGVTVRPVPNISDQPFSEVVFDGVEVPADHVVGPPYQGWSLLNAALTIERTGFEAHLKMRHWLDSVIQRARDNRGLADPLIADALVALDSQVEAGGVLAWSMIGKQVRSEIDDVGSAMSKWYNTELAKPIARLALDFDGLSGTLTQRDGAAPAAGRAAGFYPATPGLTLSAGTSEIMLYAITGGHLRVHDENTTASPLDDRHAAFRKRLKGFLASGATDWSALTKSSTVRLTLPRAAGGLGQGIAESLVVMEEMGKVRLRGPYSATVSVAEVVASDGPRHPLWPLVGSIAEGAHRIAITADFTPPSGLSSVELLPAESGDALNGRAEFVPFAGQADWLAVVALTLAGPALVLVRRDETGVVTYRRDDLGDSDLYSVEFAGTPVGPDAVLCLAGSPRFTDVLSRVHLRQSGYLVGLAQRAFDLTLAYTKKRRQFDQPIATFQHVSFRLAALSARLHAARQLVYHQASRHDQGHSEGARTAATLALAAELARDVTADAMQLHGAYGFTEAAEVQRCYRQAAVDTVLFGSPHQLRAAALGLLRKEAC
jgi:alkylation response protein AidB-like acyl-CoA dehydrogenase